MSSSLDGYPGPARTPLRDATGAVPKGLYTIPMTAQFGARVEHEVSDAAFAVGQGEYQALCGEVFIPVAMATPPGRPCPACRSILSAARQAERQVAASAASRRARHRRPGLLRRLILAGRSRRASTGIGGFAGLVRLPWDR